MGWFSVAERSTGTITSVRGPSLYSAASAGGILREVGVFNGAAVAVAVGLRRWTAAGTQGAALTEDDWDQNLNAHQLTAFNTHTADATGGNVIVVGSLGAAIGSAIIWTFGGPGVRIPEGTANGVGIYLPLGTAQILDFYFIWEE